MANITEHHAEEEGERDGCEEGGVDFLVARDAIHVDDVLGRFGEHVQGEAGRGSDL